MDIKILMSLMIIALLTACAKSENNAPSSEVAAVNSATSAGAQSPLADIAIDIPYERFVLDNGLTVVVHEDRKAPIVAVNVWYHVGSKDEPTGKTGFAHLFEHLMFNGTENFDKDPFFPLEKVGGKDLNGSTWFDRTNYFETIPTPALEMALWLESDRMGHLLGAVTQEKLDNQIGVVQNEKRQGDAQPYGKMEYPTLEGLFPPGHPYRHSTIGSLEDIGNASLDDVHGWFKQYYGAANTVLVLTGDIDTATAKPLAEKYFGHIPAGPPLSRKLAWVPGKESNQIEEMFDEVPNVRISRNWAVPSRTEREKYLLQIAMEVLAGSKNSPLYQALVYQNQLAANVRANVQPFELASMLEIEVNLKPGADRAEAERLLNQTVAEFLANGASAHEVQRAQTQIIAGTIRGLENIGGFGGKAVTLAQGQLYANDPLFVKTSLDWIKNATPEDVNATTRKWLSKGYYQLTAIPNQSYSVTESKVDRSLGLPEPNAVTQLTFPEVQEATLSNGINVVYAQRATVPVVQVALQFDAGYAADDNNRPGIANFALDMMDEGTQSLSALEISAQAEDLGAIISVASNPDVSTALLNSLAPNLDDSLTLFADVVRHPVFDDKELERLRQQFISRIKQNKADLVGSGIRILPKINYDADHPYAKPWGGLGTEAVINSIQRGDLVEFYQRWIRPDNATAFVVGDISLDEAVAKLEKAFGDWQNPAVERGVKSVATKSAPKGGRIILIDQPSSPSTLIIGTQLVPPKNDENTLTLDTASDIFGGAFTSRLNMNIREDKGWAYYAYSTAIDAREERMWFMYSPIQTDKTAAALMEMRKEISDYIERRPATAEEMAQIVEGAINGLPGAFESSGAVLGNLLESARFGRPYDYINTLAARYQGLSLAEINKLAQQELQPQQIDWLLVGDLSQIEQEVRALNVGPVEIWDKEGNVVAD